MLKKIKFESENIQIDDKKFMSTSGLYNLLFHKNPRNFTPDDHLVHKKNLEFSGVYRNSKGYLKHQACPAKFSKMTNSCRSRNRELMQTGTIAYFFLHVGNPSQKGLFRESMVVFMTFVFFITSKYRNRRLNELR